MSRFTHNHVRTGVAKNLAVRHTAQTEQHGERTLPEVLRLFDRNRMWSDRLKEINPDYFSNLAKQQKPEIFWIGCADSRVAANQIIDLPPGEVFVHRNIANVVVHSDLNCLSVLQYAVEVLGVRAVIVCGHYGCGGVAASMTDDDHGLIDNWLNHIRNVQRLHHDELEGLDHHQREHRLCELNVIEQVRNVTKTTIVRDAWRAGNGPEVHGWVYGLGDGLLRQLCVQKPDDAELNVLPSPTKEDCDVHH